MMGMSFARKMHQYTRVNAEDISKVKRTSLPTAIPIGKIIKRASVVLYILYKTYVIIREQCLKAFACLSMSQTHSINTRTLQRVVRMRVAPSISGERGKNILLGFLNPH